MFVSVIKNNLENPRIARWEGIHENLVFQKLLSTNVRVDP